MATEKHYDAIVIGAGVGGLTAGTLLAHSGQKVLILEKADRVGGRALSIKGEEITQNGIEWYKNLLRNQYTYLANPEPELKQMVDKKMLDGYTLDIGYHGVSMNGNGYMLDFEEIIGGIDDVQMNGSHYGTYYKNEFYMDLVGSQQIDPKYLKIIKKEKLPFLKFYTTPYELTDEEIDKLEGVSLLDWGTETGLTKNEIIWNNICSVGTIFSTINNPADISIGDMFRYFKHVIGPKVMKGLVDYIGGFVTDGVMAWSHSVTKKFNRLGGELYLNTTVKEVMIENGNIKGLIAQSSDGKKLEFTADKIISNVPIQDTFKFIDKTHFPDTWVEAKENMYGYGSYTPYMGLNKLVMPEEHAKCNFKNGRVLSKADGFDWDVFICWGIQSVVDPKSAPEGKYLYTAYLPMTEKESKNRQLVDKIVARLPDFMEEIYPGFKESIDWKLDLVCWKLEGVAKSISQAGTQKVPVKSEHVNGLYFAGDTAKGYGVAMDCACSSGIICASEILNKDFGVR